MYSYLCDRTLGPSKSPLGRTRIPADVQLDMLLEGRKLVERATRWLVRSRPRPLDIAAEIERFAPGAALLSETLGEVLHGADRTAFQQSTSRYAAAGVN